MSIFSKSLPAVREPEQRPVIKPELSESFVMHATTRNTAAVLPHQAVIWIEDLLANPQGYGEFWYERRLLKHETQSVGEFNAAADLAVGLAKGQITKPLYLVPRRHTSPPYNCDVMSHGIDGKRFALAEDKEHQAQTSGWDVDQFNLILWPGQSEKNLRHCAELCRAARKKWLGSLDSGAKRKPLPDCETIPGYRIPVEV